MSEHKENKVMIETSKEIGKQGTEEIVPVVASTKAVSSKPSPKPKQELVKLSQTELETLDYTDFSTPARMYALGKTLAKSSMVPLNSADDVVVALMTGKELGLPFITSVSQIYPINGRPTLGVHLQKALCLTNGVIFEKIEDAVDIFTFAKADDSGKAVLVESVNSKGEVIKVPVILSEGTLQEQPPKSVKMKVDNRTTYLFTREIKMPSGKYKEVTAKGSFSLREAREAGLFDKDVWQKYWRRMLDARAFTNGTGEIADDIINGLKAPNEVDSNFYINDEGKEVPYIEV